MGAITDRTSNVRDLFFGHQGTGFQLAVELQIPQDRLEKLPDDQQYHFVRYEVSIGINEELEETHILDEQVILQKEPSERSDRPERLLFSCPDGPARYDYESTFCWHREKTRHQKSVQWKRQFLLRNAAESKEKEDGLRLFAWGQGNLHWRTCRKMRRNFPVSTWLRETLIEGTQRFMLNSLILRQSSRPGQGRMFNTGRRESAVGDSRLARIILASLPKMDRASADGPA